MGGAVKEHDVVVLAIDQGTRSGWAILTGRERVVCYGTTTNHTHRRAVMERAHAEANKAPSRPLVVALEGHDNLPASLGANTQTLLGLGASRGRWQEVAEMTGQPSRRVVQIGVADWRRRTFGKKSKGLKRAAYKAMAVEAVSQLYTLTCTHDEAEAVLIGAAAFHHPAVEAAVNPRYHGVSWEPALAKWRGRGNEQVKKPVRDQASPDRKGTHPGRKLEGAAQHHQAGEGQPPPDE